MLEGIGDLLVWMQRTIVFLVVFAVPLALWKLWDIFWWVYERIANG